MPPLTFKAYIHKSRFYMAECPELGLMAHGDTPDRALAYLRQEAIEYIVSLGAEAEATLALLARHADRSGPSDRGVMVRRFTVEPRDLEQHGAEGGSGA